MNNTGRIDDFVALTSDWFWIPFYASVAFGAVSVVAFCVAMVLAIRNREFPILDRFGISVAIFGLILYLVLPYTESLEPFQLDVRRHGFFSLSGFLFMFVFMLTVFFQVLWGLYRVFIGGLSRAAVSITLFGFINAFTLVLGYSIAVYYQVAWTT